MFPAVLVRSFEFSNGTHIAPHTHRSNQLIYSVRGSMAIQTDRERWYIPTRRGVWMPAEMSHSIDCYGDVLMKTAFIRRDRSAGMPNAPCEIAISDLLREMLLHMADKDTNDPAIPTDHILEVIKHLFDPVSASALAVPLFAADRLTPIVQTLLSNPCDRTSLQDWAARLNVSPRTITRQFKRATGLSFQQWKQQVALLHALNLLANGRTTTAVSEELGYENTGSFIELFKKRFRVTPGQYFA